jgi:hypothetical protein
VFSALILPQLEGCFSDEVLTKCTYTYTVIQLCSKCDHVYADIEVTCVAQRLLLDAECSMMFKLLAFL